jgi:hypothetical protein
MTDHVPPSDLSHLVRRTLAAMPAWVRTDLTAKDHTTRTRAEEVLAAMIEAAIKQA